ncbi:hypothetical protein [Streptomyces sp. NPDC047014]|uniref:hypothetical protein n=1 Tax=Streptomyces sp. NPDC047014 TaxID=3155736 RepID=UPI0033C6DF62
MGQKTTTRDVGTEPEKQKLELSAAQVAGSSLATVAAALLASKLGVYGTILGAGVVSVVATAGGPVIQHLFRRTGEQLRETTGPRARQVPPPAGEPEAPAASTSGEFGAATVHGTRMRGWKRTAVASGAAFALAIGGLGTYEAVAGTSVSSGGGTLFSGGTRTAGPDRQDPPSGGPAGKDRRESQDPEGGEKDGGNGKGGKPDPPGEPSGPAASPEPSRSPGSGSSGPDPSPSGSGPAPSPSTQSPTPAPTPSAGTPGARSSSPAPGPS